MDRDQTREIIESIKLPIDDPQFYTRAFTLAAKARKQAYSKDGDNFKRVTAEEYDDLSRRLDRTRFQESTSVRNVLRTRRLANLLINDKGELNLGLIPKVISHLKSHLYSLGPNRQYDAKRQEHILKVLTLLSEKKELVLLLKTIGKPYSHKHADQIIRDTLQLPENTPVTDAHARRAVLSAWMCYLRQNVGSCFATAPAIIVHDEQPELFLKDINEMLGTGRLKRTFGGIEYSVPLSKSWGAGDLRKPFFLPKGPELEENDIWYSPGLLAGFEAAGLILEESALKEKIEQAKILITTMINQLEWNQPFVLISAEEIIQKVLLKHLGITEKDLQDYENRPAGMIQSGLLMQVPQAAVRGGGKGEACASFFLLFEKACNALKSLTDNALLKSWEFTLASFSETKSQFTRWNLYASLGLGAEEKGGIGQAIYKIIKDKLEAVNQKVKDIQFEYEQVFNHLKSLEVRIRHASTEKEAQWIRMEYQTKRNEFYTLEEIRDDTNQKAHRFANLFNVLIEQYDALFPKYFQEVYDADMHDVNVGPYDDSPAGFRLLYKYGRANTSQWTPVKKPSEFIDCLASFFVATETELSVLNELQGLQSDLSEITTSIVNHIRTKEFLETAFYRMAAAHQTRIVKDPLEHLDQIEKKPWAYTSGGTMGTLVSCYYRREQKPTEVSRWVESPLELLVYFIDTMKQIPPKLMEDYIKFPKKSMLIHSPTHAFLLKPGVCPFKESWQNDAFSYTWARDNYVLPREKFVQSLWLDEEGMRYLVQNLVKLVPVNFQHYFLKSFEHLHGPMSTVDFRNTLLGTIQKERGLRYGGSGVLNSEEIDSALYQALPLFAKTELRDKVETIFKKVAEIDAKDIAGLMETFDLASETYSENTVISATSLQDICKAILCLYFADTSANVDYHQKISKAAQQLGYAMPEPIFFADTNWVKDEFAFVVNPGTGRLDLWRIDLIGNVGAPMSSWQQWLDGSRKDISWGIYTRPVEYSS